MKRIKASIKQLVGLNLDDPMHKFWIRYFTSKFPKSSSKLQPPYSTQINEFNLNTIKSKDIFTHAKEIEANPENTLPIYLQFNQNLGLQYFEFCETFLAAKDIQNKAAVLEIAEPHLMRFAIAFFYQFITKFQFLYKNEDAPGFPVWFLDKYFIVHTVLILGKDDAMTDYTLYILIPIVHFLQKYLTPLLSEQIEDANNPMYPMKVFVKKMVLLFCDFYAYNQNKINNYMYPTVSFISLFCTRAITGNLIDKEKNNNYLYIIEKSLNIFSQNDISTTVTASNILAFITHLLFYLAKIKSKDDFYQKHLILGRIAFRILSKLSTITIMDVEQPFIRITKDFLAKSILDYVEAIFNHLTVQPFKYRSYDTTVYNSALYENQNFDFLKHELVKIEDKETQIKKFGDFPKSLLIGKDASNSDQEVNEILPVLFNEFKTFMSKHTELATVFCSMLINEGFVEKSDNEHIEVVKKLFALFAAKYLPPSLVNSDISKKCLWNQVLDNYAFVSLEYYDKDFVDIIEELAINCFSVAQFDQYQLIENLSNLLLTSFISNVIDIVDQLLLTCPARFKEQIHNSTFVDMMYHIDSSIKNLILKNLNPSNKNLIIKRSKVISIIRKIANLSPSELVKPEERCSYLISLLFEVHLQDIIVHIISLALLDDESTSTIVIQQINKYFCASIHKNNEYDWKLMVQKVTMAISSSANINKIGVCSTLINTSSLLTFHKIVQSSNDYQFKLSILTFITNLCCCSPLFLREFSNPQWNFHETWTEVFKKKKEETGSGTLQSNEILLLWKLSTLGDDSLIRSIEGLRLLVTVTKNDSVVFKNVVSQLLEKCKYSLINRFHCSQADIIITILGVYEEVPEYVELLKAVGSSFFKPNELNFYLQNIQKNPKYTLSMLNVLSETIQSSSTKEMKSFFHIDRYHSQFCLQNSQFNFYPSVSFYVRFENCRENNLLDFITYNIYSNDSLISSITLSLNNLEPFLKYNNNNVTNSNKTQNSNNSKSSINTSYSTSSLLINPLNKNNGFGKIESLVWIKFYLIINSVKKEVTLLINDEKINEWKIPSLPSIKQIQSSASPLFTFVIKTIPCDIENVTFYDQQQNIATCYSAKVIEGTTCPNVYQGFINDISLCGSIVNFNGFSVPYMIRIANTIVNCGGIQILLPLFEMAKTNPNILLKAIVTLAKYSEQMFVEQSFFRALSDILPPKITVETLQILCDIYRSVKTNEVRTELLTNIFCNWNILSKLEKEKHVVFTRTILPIVLGSQPDLFIKYITVKSFFMPVFFENEIVWDLVEKLSAFQFTRDDVISMMSAAIDSTNKMFALNALKTILSAMNKHDNVIEILSEYGYFYPFFSVFEKFDEEIWLVVLQIFNAITKQKPDSELTSRFLNCFSLINLEKISEKTLNLVLSFIFSNEKSAKNQFIQNPQFIPFLCLILSHFPKEKSKGIAILVRNSINVYEISQKNVAELSFWPFWLLFLTVFEIFSDNVNNKDKTIEDWVSAISKVSFQHEFSVFAELETFFFVFSSIFQLDFVFMILVFFKSALRFKQSLQLISEALKFMVFCPKLEIKKTFSPDIMKSLQQLSTYLVNVPIDSLTFEFSLDNILLNNGNKAGSKGNNGLDSVLSELIKVCLAYFLANKDIASKSVNFSSESSLLPASSLLLLVIHILTITNFDSACGCIDQVLEIPAIKSSKKNLNFLYNDFKIKDNDAKTQMIKKVLINENSAEHFDLIGFFTEETNKIQECFEAGKQKTLNSITRPYLEQIYNSDLIKRCQLPNFSEILKENTEATERLSRQNHRLWTNIVLDLVENGQIWNPVLSENQHWKLNHNDLDSIGRRMKLKINRHFNNHKDASLAREKKNEGESCKRMIRQSLEEEEDDDKKGVKTFVFKLDCTLVSVSSYYKGTVYFTNNLLSFESVETTDEFGNKKESRPKMVEISYQNMKFSIKRRFLQQKVGAEVFTKQKRSFFFIFESNANRSKFIHKLKSSGCPIMSKIDEITKKWKTGKMTNYEYLYWLNMFSGRSFNDIAQYPVFPWVLNNYNSDCESLDLNDPNIFRDLSKPVGALNEERLENLKEMYNELLSINNETAKNANGEKNENCCSQVASLYRLHYSAPGYVVYFLIRCEPFTSLHISLQSGRFDHPCRLFRSIGDSYNSCVSTSSDFRELIPEFFSIGEFLLNSEHYDLGKDVNDVEIPKWSKSVAQFVALNRLALESPHVSMHINEWIDLIFGYKQQDLSANNLFHLYSDPAYFDSRKSKEEQKEIMNYAANFGVNPSKLFNQAHANRAFIPFSPNFTESQRLDLKLVLKNFKPLLIWSTRNISITGNTNELNAVLLPGVLYSSSLEKRNVNNPNDSNSNNNTNNTNNSNASGSNASNNTGLASLAFHVVSKFPFRFPQSLTRNDIIDKHIAVANNNNFYNNSSSASSPTISTIATIVESASSILVVSNPWSQVFDVVDAAKNKIVFSSTELSPSAITSIAVDNDLIVSSSQDASMCIWSISKKRMVANLIAHSHPVVCIAVNEGIDLIASCDVTGKFSYSSVVSSNQMNNYDSNHCYKFMRSIKLDKAPTKIMISSLGFSILFFEERNLGDITTILESYDMSQRRIEVCKIPGDVTCSCLCEFQDSSQYLLVAMTTKKVFLYSVLDLTRRAAYGEVDSYAKACTFCSDKNEIFLSLDNGDILSYQFV